MSKKPTNSFLRRMLKTRLGRVFTHSGFIAGVLGIITFYLIGFSPEPYLFELERTEVLSDPPKRPFTYYADFNLDGHEERFILNNGPGLDAYVVVLKDADIPLDQWNFLGSLGNSSKGYFVGNYDHDSSLEIACFSLKGNSIYLNIVEPYGDTTHLVKNRLIDTIWSSGYSPSLNVEEVQFCSLNRDGYDELVFSLHSGNARQPRKIYSYDLRADSLRSSPLSGILLNNPLILDIDRDGRKEIICGASGSNNYPQGGISYPDTASWLVILDDRLNYRVPPLSTGGLFSHNFPVLIEKEGQPVLYDLVTGANELKSYSRWYMVNSDFSIEKASPFSNCQGLQVQQIVKSSSGIHQLLLNPLKNQSLFGMGGMIADSVVIKSLKGYIPILNYEAGIPQFEYACIVGGENDELQFLNRTGKKMAAIELNYFDEEYRSCWIGLVNGRHQLLLSGLKHNTWFSVRPNPWQYLQYLILIGVIVGFYGFITFIRFIQSQQLARQESMRKEVLELQLKAVRNQLDPHFTFNALNALSALSMTGDTKGIDQFIGFFSRLLRTYLNTSDQVLVSLRDEIEFVVNYAELQRIRFENAFRMVLEVSKETDLERKVPKMLIQTHVENAIKHGLRPREGLRMKALDSVSKMEGSKTDTGIVKVTIAERDQSLLIVIEDNGVGRGHSTVSTFESTGKGLKALEKIIVSVKQLYGMEITQEIEDLTEADGSPGGTRVKIEIE